MVVVVVVVVVVGVVIGVSVLRLIFEDFWF